MGWTVSKWDTGLTWKCLHIQCLRAENTPVIVPMTMGAGSFSSLDVLRRLGKGECSRRGERSRVLRGEGGGVLAVELHMMAGMLDALGRSCTMIAGGGGGGGAGGGGEGMVEEEEEEKKEE